MHCYNVYYIYIFLFIILTSYNTNYSSAVTAVTVLQPLLTFLNWTVITFNQFACTWLWAVRLTM